MNTRLTARAIKVLKYAQYEAQDMERNYIGTEHLLLGLLHESDGLAAQALMALGIDLDMVHERVESVLGADDDSTSDKPYYTPRAKRVMELAVDEARRLGHNYLGTEHILLGLIRENDSAAARVLRSLGAELEHVRRQVMDMLGGDYDDVEDDEMEEGRGRAEGARSDTAPPPSSR